MTPLITMPMPATIITIAPSVGGGMEKPADRFGADRADGYKQE